MQTFYPVFESGQVLTNAHLNQLTTWLNEQQLATRRKLLGIGIVCGLEVSGGDDRISVSQGVGVTSAGHLICVPEDSHYGRYRPYALPVSTAVEDSSDIDEIEVEQLLPLADLQLWELLTDEFESAPGEPVPQALDSEFLADKVVMLLLEAQQQSLKNCDLNDCADKGARQQFVVRTLVLSETRARELWQSETLGSAELEPRDLNWQAIRDQLQPLAMGRLIVSAAPLGSLEEVRNQAAQLVNQGWQLLKGHLQGSFDGWAYLLRQRFPREVFPTDPWEEINPSLAGAAQNAKQLMEQLHSYDQLQDVIASYNEFLDAACEFDALCCPEERRFPFHLLLGKPKPPQVATQPGNLQFSQVNFNLGAALPTPTLRHPFYPSMALQQQRQQSARMVDLYYRTWLLFQRYRSDNLSDKPLRILPSRRFGELSTKAIPYYYDLRPLDDLHRNWSPDATRCGRIGRVNGYAVSSTDPDPLTQVPNDHDFYRIEGLLGKPLADTLGSLKSMQRELGLSFGIEPVFLPVQPVTTDKEREAHLALLMRNQTLLRLFKCRISDLDALFLLVLAVIFQLLLSLVYLLARLGGQKEGSANRVEGFAVDAVMVERVVAAGNDFNLAANMIDLQKTSAGSETADFLLKQVQDGQIIADDLLLALDESEDSNGINAEIYLRAKQQTSGDLRERIAQVIGANASEPQLEQTYQSARMLQHAESLLQQASNDSIARFDFDQFQGELQALDTAYLALRPEVSTDSNDQKAMLASLDSNLSMLKKLSQSALLTSMRSELTKRMNAIFEQFSFDGYVDRHSGLEHQCGVTKGGTLVLAYTHKALLSKYAPAPSETEPEISAANFAAVVSNAHISSGAFNLELARNANLENLVLANRTGGMALTEAVRNLNLSLSTPAESGARAIADELSVFRPTAVAEDDPLNDFVVVADFCLPTYCCDSDCADLEFARPANEPEAEEPAPTTKKIVVRGFIVDASSSVNTKEFLAMRRDTAKPQPIIDAELAVVDRNNKPVRVKMVRGSFTFSVAPGEYLLRATAPGYSSSEERRKILAPLNRDMVIRLEPTKKRAPTDRIINRNEQ
ncbi:carboxypeptidase-like regulatory domain-containing protein [Marinobacterium sp. YM272]|uniref:carboxypeptidase-like regulatory domain-containing protein n=1 Tax=Marinobacterium sp. YM272 TaxID=3421654 RepID=UPI003D7FD53D